MYRAVLGMGKCNDVKGMGKMMMTAATDDVNAIS